MAVNPIPPQAYTKDTMLRAYSWLQNQSLHIREMATTPDILVSLYLKTTWDGEGALDRPSIQNFKNELRSLAGLMGELESAPTEAGSSPQPFPPQSPQLTSAPPNAPTKQSLPPLQGSNPQPKKKSEPLARAEELFFADVSDVKSTKSDTGGSTLSSGDQAHTVHSSIFDLDQQSLEMIREVKTQLNLSSETEALRAIVRLGHLQVTRLFR
ncbi:MAG: hypothetical protein IPK04_03700 [Bdellovibrionales bacterium]|nr:hypothetical protein [Bdellovibrionales bacterium]